MSDTIQAGFHFAYGRIKYGNKDEGLIPEYILVWNDVEDDSDWIDNFNIDENQMHD